MQVIELQVYMDLDIIEENINNQSDNSTRFIIISKNIETDPSCNKVSVVFSLEHKAGTFTNY